MLVRRKARFRRRLPFRRRSKPLDRHGDEPRQAIEYRRLSLGGFARAHGLPHAPAIGDGLYQPECLSVVALPREFHGLKRRLRVRGPDTVRAKVVRRHGVPDDVHHTDAVVDYGHGRFLRLYAPIGHRKEANPVTVATNLCWGLAGEVLREPRSGFSAEEGALAAMRPFTVFSFSSGCRT